MEVDLGDFRMSRECKNAYKTLKDDLNIIISKPDEGAGVVILDRVDDNQKMRPLIRNTACISDIFDFVFALESGLVAARTKRS